MNNIKTIKNIAEVVAGYTFRSALPVQSDGRMLVVQAKDVGDNICIDDAGLVRIGGQEYKTNAIIKRNDVVVSVRGNFRAGVFESDLQEVIASSSVYILRLTDEDILPEYLAIFLNSAVGQKQIKQSLTGGAIKTILRKDLEDLEIVIPEVAKQKLIINIYKNNKKQQELLEKKQSIINKVTDNAINKLLNC